MRTTTYTCDWCQTATNEKQMYEVTVHQVGASVATQFKAELCYACLIQAQKALDQRKEAR